MNRKRSMDEPEPDERSSRIKLASPSPERTSGSDTESILSFQGYDTTNISDTASPPLPVPGVEYEVASPKKQIFNTYYFSDESAEVEFEGVSDFPLPTLGDGLDNALLADTSEENSTSPTSNSDADPGLPRNDYLDFEKCVLCKTEEKNISYPFCPSCFTWRKNLFPKRPRRRKIDIRKALNHSGPLNENNECSICQTINEGVCSEKTSENGNSSAALFEDNKVVEAKENISENTTVAGPSKPSTSSSISTINSNKLKDPVECGICFSKRENGLFVHSNSAHLYGCYKCAQNIWYHNGSCPICRRKIHKVIKLYVS